jgi:hypothetical protein
MESQQDAARLDAARGERRRKTRQGVYIEEHNGLHEDTLEKQQQRPRFRPTPRSASGGAENKKRESEMLRISDCG